MTDEELKILAALDSIATWLYGGYNTIASGVEQGVTDGVTQLNSVKNGFINWVTGGWNQDYLENFSTDNDHFNLESSITKVYSEMYSGNYSSGFTYLSSSLNDIWGSWVQSSDWSTAGGDVAAVQTMLVNSVSTVGLALGAAMGGLQSGAKTALTTALSYANVVDEQLANLESMIDGWSDVGTGLSDSLSTISDYISGDSAIFSVIGKGIQIFSESLTAYNDGVSETTYGRLMENSWSKSSSSFLRTFQSGSGAYKINILPSDPLNPGTNGTNLYGNLMLGTPPVFNHYSDPKNRAIIKTFLRDAKFLSLTPGYPQYNGSNYLLSSNSDQYHQTTSGNSMLEYLINNGLNGVFAKADRRYYTFKTCYSDYYAYLESMLEPIWIRMGLASDGAGSFNLFSFFKILDDSGNINPDNSSTLKEELQSSLGFYVNPTGTLTESINNSETSYGHENKSTVEASSETYQRINYITGMGTGGNVRNATAMAAKSLQVGRNLKTFISDSLSGTISGIKSFKSDGIIAGAINTASGVLSDTQRFLTEQDNGAVLQSYATTNGMRVQYPELWSDSNYMKSVNINFEFISPYGDPLSIFQYVIVPFCALITFAMPRQAADNGYVSPFFVRADIPGYFTSDLAMISDFNWTKGGDGNIWTKDGLPRAISGSFTIQDLYPYLAMTKRYSFLSANPNYSVWLDNLAGMHAVYTEDSESNLNDYWKAMLNRVNGLEGGVNQWNTFDSASRSTHKDFMSKNRTNLNKTTGSSIPWMRNG